MTRTMKKKIAAAAVAMAVALSSLATVHAATAPLTDEQIANATYPIEGAPGGAVQLQNGKYDDAAAHYAVQLVPPSARGDLNADGAQDAAVHLAVNAGGSGVFSYLAAVLNNNGAANPLPAVFLGDRIVVRSIRIAGNGEIGVLLLERRYDQPMSARPTIPVVRRFKVAGNELVASSPLSASELNNATYPLEIAKDGQATFARGVYEDQEAQIKAILAPSPRANGDLDGDTSPDAAVPIIVNSAGSGVFTYIAAVLNNGGLADPVDSVFIGDRITLSNLSIEGGVLTVNYLDRKPDEPMSAKPTVPTTKQFALQNGKLVEASATAQPLPVQPTPIQQVDYTCADNVTFTVVFAGEVATITFNGQTQELKQQPSGSGIIYANDNWQLQGKGVDAMLTDLKSNTVVAKDCKGKAFQAIVPAPAADVVTATTAATSTVEVTATAVAAPALSGNLNGEVYYLQRIALPDNAVVAVRLRQVLPDVAPAVASQVIEAKGRQQPFPFALTYDPAKIDPEGVYVVEAVIAENGKVRWVPATLNYVLTNGAPQDNVRIQVNQVASVGQRDSQPAAGADVMATLSSNPRFSTLVKLVSDAGLVDEMTNLQNGTVFAPTNDAFASLPAGAMDELQGNKQMLMGILSYHVSPELIDAKTLAGKTEVPTMLQDLSIRVKSEGGKVLLNDSTEIAQADIPAGSNLIHAITGVLTPFETFGMADKTETQPAATKPTTPTAPALSGILTGTVSYLQRMALPPNATVEVTLADVSRMDVAATVIATQTIATEGRQVPIAYELKYDPAVIDQKMTYAVSARILVDGKLRFISTQRYAALTRGAPVTDINIIVQPVQ